MNELAEVEILNGCNCHFLTRPKTCKGTVQQDSSKDSKIVYFVQQGSSKKFRVTFIRFAFRNNHFHPHWEGKQQWEICLNTIDEMKKISGKTILQNLSPTWFNLNGFCLSTHKKICKCNHCAELANPSCQLCHAHVLKIMSDNLLIDLCRIIIDYTRFPSYL
jgi:hypothetical protein